VIQHLSGAISGGAIYADFTSVTNITWGDCLVVRANFFRSRAIGCFGGDSWSSILPLRGFRSRRITSLTLRRLSFSGDPASQTGGPCFAGTEQFWCLNRIGCLLAPSSICRLVLVGRRYVILRRSRRISLTEAKSFASLKRIERSILVITASGKKTEWACRA
jgi:hypothetical protein